MLEPRPFDPLGCAMYELLKLLHVVGWSAWFGLGIAEPILGAQVRKAEAANRVVLGRVWIRVGRVELMCMASAVLFGLATFFFLGSMSATGMGGFMKDKSNLYLHAMMGLGLLAGLLAFFAGQGRRVALEALEKGDEASFAAAYQRAAMMSGISHLLVALTILEVMFRSLMA